MISWILFFFVATDSFNEPNSKEPHNFGLLLAEIPQTQKNTSVCEFWWNGVFSGLSYCEYPITRNPHLPKHLNCGLMWGLMKFYQNTIFMIPRMCRVVNCCHQETHATVFLRVYSIKHLYYCALLETCTEGFFNILTRTPILGKYL